MQILTEMTEALRERLAIIGDEGSRCDPLHHTERLREVSERIDRIALRLPPPIDPQLRHFLERRSYSKALEFLEANTLLRDGGATASPPVTPG